MRFQQNPLWVRSALAAVFVSLRPLSRDPRLPAWHNYSSLSFGAGSILLFKAAGTLRYALKSFPASSARHRARYFSQTLSYVGVGSSNPRVGLHGRLI